MENFLQSDTKYAFIFIPMLRNMEFIEK
jgi:hypothetical protein